jgi:hypothetical protein
VLTLPLFSGGGGRVLPILDAETADSTHSGHALALPRVKKLYYTSDLHL